MTRTQLREAIAQNGFNSFNTRFANLIKISDDGFNFAVLMFNEGRAMIEFTEGVDLDGRRARQLSYLVHKHNGTLVYDAVLLVN